LFHTLLSQVVTGRQHWLKSFCPVIYQTAVLVLLLRWQFGLVVMHWSRSTKLLYSGPG